MVATVRACCCVAVCVPSLCVLFYVCALLPIWPQILSKVDAMLGRSAAAFEVSFATLSGLSLSVTTVELVSAVDDNAARPHLTAVDDTLIAIGAMVAGTHQRVRECCVCVCVNVMVLLCVCVCMCVAVALAGLCLVWSCKRLARKDRVRRRALIRDGPPTPGDTHSSSYRDDDIELSATGLSDVNADAIVDDTHAVTREGRQGTTPVAPPVPPGEDKPRDPSWT